MQKALKPVSYLALAATLVPGLLYLGGSLGLEMTKHIALVGTIVWFATAPLWMRDVQEVDDDQVEI